ncbi:MAG: fdrA domain protein [Candidatus Hydrogenedentota bacterium]|nr:MAG: fdrA domain protein [Candidatus Hydrogenedentota bacterium]
MREIFGKEVVVINVGLDLFAEELEKATVPVQRVAWRPPAQGKKKVQDLLARIKKKKGKE